MEFGKAMARIFNRKTAIILLFVIVFGYVVGKDRALRDNVQDDRQQAAVN